MLQIQPVQSLHIIPHVLVHRNLKQIPIQGSALVPLSQLGVLLSHKQQLLAWMSHHKCIGNTQVFRLFFQGISWHFANHGTFSVHHLVMGEYQDKVLAVRIQHGKCQLPIIVLPEKRIAVHIVGKIVHPAHVPFIIKSKSAVLWIACYLRPCRGLLGYNDRAISPLSVYCIQVSQEFHSLQVLIAPI
ncbi:hypothetical protein CLFS41_06250 [Clostridium sp. FS41]|nr:hypothetical protein CLFS41_06250 [Clostridium sp. FS41]